MKILAIRGKNIASLEREFEICFTAEPLKSAGIFAITGSTGSGKSTLLDALCLALFDASPRTSRASENIPIRDVGDKTINQRDSRNIFRRGATEGYAEVEFMSLGRQTFRSRWSVRRSRNKADGSMQNSEIRLYNLSEKTEVQGLKTELLNKISELIGLSFDQFTRSVLLAQGDFATFLKAKQAEKAELLEKLTGTDIYSRISITIYEKAKSAEADRNAINERIKGIELLPGEQIELLESEKNGIKQELSSLKKECELLASQTKWIEDKERIVKEIKQAEAGLAYTQKAIEDAAGRFGYISRIESVQEIRDTFGLLKNTDKQLTEYTKNLSNTEIQREENTKLLSDSQKALTDCEKELEELLEKQKEITPQIIKARELDVRIKEANANAEDAQKEYSAAKTAFDRIEKNITDIKNALKLCEKTASSLNGWFTENKSYETIVPRTELLIALATDAQTAYEQVKQNNVTLTSNKTLLYANIKKLEQLKQDAERLNSLLPAEIAVLREKLADGEPCPVCGSTHHPAAKAEDMQRMKEQELKKAKEDNAGQTERLANEIEKQKSEITRLSTMIDNYKVQYDKAFQSLSDSLSEMLEWKDFFERTELKEYLKTKANQWNGNLEELTKTQEKINKLTANLENEENNLKEAGETFAAKTERYSNFQKITGQLQTERSDLLHGKPADAAEKYFIDKQKIITENIKKATDNKNNCSAKQESLNGIISRIKADIEQSNEKRESLQIDIENRIKTKDYISYDDLAGLFKKDSAWIQAEKRALSLLTDAETTAKATLTERTKNLEQHNGSIAKPENEENEIVQKSLTEKNLLIETRNKRNTEIEVALSSNIKAREQIKGLEKEFYKKEEFAENWKKLNSLLGSASGNKFKEIAQGYTLDTLLTYANKHLQELSPRYKLQRIPDTLALQVVDTDMLNEVRTIHSLSGGESFLISLALALGLSSLSSNRMKVESLFIDEGFGSLDSDTLRIAMDALEQLHTQGRKIGVISHVAEMTERIAVQIRVIKTSNGKSEVEITG